MILFVVIFDWGAPRFKNHISGGTSAKELSSELLKLLMTVEAIKGNQLLRYSLEARAKMKADERQSLKINDG